MEGGEEGYCFHLFPLATTETTDQIFYKEMLVPYESEGWGVQAYMADICRHCVMSQHLRCITQ